MPSSTNRLTPEQSLALAEQLRQSNHQQQAANLLMQSLHFYPGHELLSLKLARLLHHHGHQANAITVLQKAYTAGHQSLELSYLLAALLHLEQRFHEAVAIIDTCISRFPHSAEAYNLKGSSLIECNQYNAAISAFETAIQLRPEAADAYNNLAWALRALGRKQEAIKHFEKAFAVNPQATEALSGLLLLKTYHARSSEFDTTEQLLNDAQLSIKQATELRFALGKAYEDIKDYPNAFKHVDTANLYWRRSLDYRIEDDRALFETLKRTFPQIRTSDTEYHSEPPAPLFVIGMPRSSTTLIEQIISSHSAVAGGGELPFLEQLLLGPGKRLRYTANISASAKHDIAQSYLNQARAHVRSQLHENTVYFTDKLPQNFRFAGAILQLFPQAKIIHCKRDPMDTCLSLYKHHFPMAHHHYAYDLKELGQYYRLYEDLMAHWHNIAPDRILDVQYETLLKNFEPEVRRILAFCGLAFEETCLSFEQNERVIRTASSDQVRQGLFKHGAGRWRHYEKQLQPLKTSLQSYS
jgi:tetratricopeptide (TPR) repeat protein